MKLGQVKTIDMDDVLVHLALLPSDIEMLQMCCEYAEQNIGPLDKWPEDSGMDRYAGDSGITPEDVYQFGDAWSFKFRRILEDEKKRQDSIL